MKVMFCMPALLLSMTAPDVQRGPSALLLSGK